jgi:hypothetical protein
MVRLLTLILVILVRAITCTAQCVSCPGTSGEAVVTMTDSGTSDRTALKVTSDSQNSTGTRSNLLGIDTTVKQTVAGGTVTNGYGVVIRSAVESAGTISKVYGLRIEPQTVGTSPDNFEIDSGASTSSFTTNLQNGYIRVASATFKLLNPVSEKNTALNGTIQINSTNADSAYGAYGAAESTNASGTLAQVNGFGGDAFHSGAGAVENLQGGYVSAQALSGSGADAASQCSG